MVNQNETNSIWLRQRDFSLADFISLLVFFIKIYCLLFVYELLSWIGWFYDKFSLYEKIQNDPKTNILDTYDYISLLCGIL